MSKLEKSQFSEFWYQSSDGLRLFARDYSAHCQRNTDGPVVICLHGLTRNSADYTELCERLCSKYRIYALDVRGRGKSDYDTDPLNYHVYTYLSDLKAFVAEIAANSVILIGTSMGGFISMLFAADSPTLIKGIVLNDIGPEANLDGVARIMKYISKPSSACSWDDAIGELKSLNSQIYPDFKYDDWLAFAKKLYREDETGVPRLDYDEHIVDVFKQAPVLPESDKKNETNPADFWPTFEMIRDIPMLLIRGAMSDILDRSCVHKMQQRHSDFAFVEIAHRGHTPLLNEPESEQAIDAFLDKP